MSNRPEPCPICGRRHVGRCDPKLLERMDWGRMSHTELGRERPRSYHQRLREGFELIELAEDGGWGSDDE